MTTTQHSTLPSTDTRTIFGRAARLAGATIAAVTPEQRHLPTPCTDLDVAQLVDHLVVVLQRVEALGAGRDPMALPPTGADDADRWNDTWAEALARTEAAWPDEALDRPMTLPWATLPGRAMLAQYTNELSVHTWDLARATGQQPAWDDEVLAVGFEAIRRGMPAEGRAERFAAVAANLPAGVPFVPPFAEAVTVPDDAPIIDRLVAWNGRDPR